MTYPWKDYAGRISPLKLTIFAALFVPVICAEISYVFSPPGTRPLTELNNQIGLWAIRLVFVALAITPLRHILQWSRLLVVRRMLGVGAFAYATSHLALYAADRAFDLAKITAEVAVSISLMIGLVALVGLAALTATSTAAMIRRLGSRRWRVLHRLLYVIALLALVHYWIEVKLEPWEPMIMTGIYAWLMVYRMLARPLGSRTRLSHLGGALLAVGVAMLTALGEASYLWAQHGAEPLRVIAAHAAITTGVRPALVVLGVTLGVAAAGSLRLLFLRTLRFPARGKGSPGGRGMAY
jgi:sulfoxide reductase heme-binding subunit YedZ